MKQIFIFIFLLLFISKGNAQLIKHADLKIYVSQLVSGFFDGWHEAIAYHGWGAGKPFFDYKTSWKRKYRNYDAGDMGPAFFGSKTFLVGFTDGNHMARGISRLFMTGSIYFAMGEKDSWLERIKEIVLSSVINRLSFMFAYKYIFNH